MASRCRLHGAGKFYGGPHAFRPAHGGGGLRAALCALLLPALAATADTTFVLGGTVRNLRPGFALYFALYSSEEGFKKRAYDKSLLFAADKIVSDSVEYVFQGVRPGQYVIAAFQDLDGDRHIGMGLFGPTEPYCIYKPNYGMFGPRFHRCKFPVDRDITDADFSLSHSRK